MKTKNIFRTLLMAAMLLVGVGSAQATILWSEGASEGSFKIEGDNFDFAGATENSKLLIHYSYINEYGFKFGVLINDAHSNDNYTNWQGTNYGSKGGYQDRWNGYNDYSKGYFELILSDIGAQEIIRGGLEIYEITNITISQVELLAGDSPITPKFTLTYISQGDTLKTERLAEGATPTRPTTNPTKDGYKFAGWDNLPETMPAHDVTVTAQFEVIKYTITYKIAGEVYATVQLAPGEAVVPPTPEARTHYTFSWGYNVPETMPAYDVIIEGAYTAVSTHTLTYSYTVNWSDSTTYKTYTVYEGDPITPEANPTLEGYTFDGWSEIPATMPNYDVTIRGNFTAITKYVIFMIDGAEYKRIAYNYGDAIATEQDAYRYGYTFSGWSGYPSDMTMGNEDIVITGSFTANEHSLIYIVDGQEVARYEVAYGTSITLDAEPAQRPGYKFSGWSTIPSTMPDNDVSVYGNFQEVEMDKYTIYYQVDEQVVSQERLVEGAKPNPPAVAYKTGYTFKRWTGVPSAMPAEDVIVTAEFEINSYKLTYMVDGDEYYYYYVNYGSVIEPESEPSRNGYEFSGWLNVPETMPAKDVVIEGYFKPEAQYVEAVISSSTGYATFCSNFPLNFTRVQGLKAYIARSISTDVVELQQVTGVVPAGTGLILKGESDRIPVADSDGSAISGNLLVGVTDTDQTLSSTGYYVLTEELIEGEEVVAKFAETGANTAIVPAGHAYLIAPSSNSRSHLSIVFSKQTTGIGGAWVSEGADEVISDLQGHRVLNPKKGRLYIIGGRKVVLK